MAGPVESVMNVMMDDMSWGDLKSIAAAVEYQGFNPRKVAAAVLSRIEEYDATKHETKTAVVGDVTFKYSLESTTLDLYFLITLFLIRGNYVVKILATIPSDLKVIVTRKLSALGIATAGAEKRLTASSVTLARLSQTFPHVTATIIVGKNFEGKLQPKWLLGSVLPLIMQHSVFSGLIPKGCAAFEELKTIALALNLEMTVMLQVPKEKRKMENRDISELTDMSEKYVMAAINGSLCPDAVQTRIMKHSAILDARGNLGETAIAIHAACAKFLNMKERSYKDAVKIMSAPPSAGPTPAIPNA